MKQSRVYICLCLLLLNLQNANAAGVPTSTVKHFFGDGEAPVAYVTDHWFFIAPSATHRVTGKATRSTVHPGEDFGVIARFVSINPTVQMQIRLTVPYSPESYPCSKCKPGELTISPDRTTVILNEEVDSSRDHAGFYWGVADEDPKGKYKIQLLIDGVPVETYSFQVL